MPKFLSVLLSIILVIVLLGGTVFYFYSVKRSDMLTFEEELICNAFIASLKGDTTLDSYDISDEYKQLFLDFQKENTIPNDTPVLLLENVSDFYAYSDLKKSFDDTVASLNIGETSDVELTDEVQDFLDSFEINTDYEFKIATGTEDVDNPYVYEQNNNYYIDYGHIFFDEYNQMIITHKGFTTTLFEKDYGGMTYKKRALLNPFVVDKQEKGNKVNYLFAGCGTIDKVLIMTRGSNSITDVKIGNRSDFPIMP